MNHQLVCATANPHKQREFEEILTPLGITLTSHPGIDVEETEETLLGNAILKGATVAAHCGLPAIAEDSGLFVAALSGLPGIYSARFANCLIEKRQGVLSIQSHELVLPNEQLQGQALSQANNSLLLSLMSELGLTGNDRLAYFQVALVVVDPSGKLLASFVESAHGKIADSERGTNGFAYDRVFIGDETGELTFAEIQPEQKNRLSHRGKALCKFAKWANSQNGHAR